MILASGYMETISEMCASLYAGQCLVLRGGAQRWRLSPVTFPITRTPFRPPPHNARLLSPPVPSTRSAVGLLLVIGTVRTSPDPSLFVGCQSRGRSDGGYRLALT